MVKRWWARGTQNLTALGGNPNLLWDVQSAQLAVIDHNQAFDPDFNAAHFLASHVFASCWNGVSADLVEQAGYVGRMESALADLETIRDSIPASWWFVDEGVPADVSWDEIVRCLERCRRPDLENNVRKLLLREHLGGAYRPEKVGRDDFAVNFPFVHVHEGRAERVIKPLYLAQDDSTKILTHGGQWVDKVRRLRKRDALPAAVLFPVQPPAPDAKAYGAFEEIRDDLHEVGVTVVPAGDAARIVQFAAL